MSASDIFTIGSSGLRTYQTQLSTISQNITNAGSQDYSRRTTTVRESAASTATAPLYLQRANFSGSEMSGGDFSSLDWRAADFTHCDLTGSKLCDLDLRRKCGYKPRSRSEPPRPTAHGGARSFAAFTFFSFT